jgi:nucleolar protein 12
VLLKRVLPKQDEELIRLFGDGKGAGNVTAVRVVRDAKTNRGKGFAFVEFSEKGFARMALAADGRPLRERLIRVTRVARPGAREETTRLRTPFSRGGGCQRSKPYGMIPFRLTWC